MSQWRLRALAATVSTMLALVTVLASPGLAGVASHDDPGPSLDARLVIGFGDDDDDDDEDDGFESLFEPIGDRYRPLTDAGSPYGIARRIGLTDVDLTGAGVDIALIDTGVVDVRGLRHSSVVHGPDFSFEDAVPQLRSLDTNGHGTHLAGIIVGSDWLWSRGVDDRLPGRVLGVAPDARLVSLKVAAADGAADVTQVIAAINWVIENRAADGMNIRVLNLAYGTDGAQPHEIDPLAHAVERAWRAGIVVVAAAGNDGRSGGALRNPASDPHVIAVGAAEGASAGNLLLSDFSSRGTAQRSIDIAAPGESIVSLRTPGSYSDAMNSPGRVGRRLVRGTGTSQSAAIITGAVALLLEDRPELTPDQVKQILVTSATGHDSGAVFGAGFIDIAAAVATPTPETGSGASWSTGTGSIHLARGSARVSDGGVALVGDVDVFGNDWSADGWATDSWSNNSWDGDSWTHDPWSGTSWTGGEWSSMRWMGNSWTGSEWSGSEWSGSEWSGSEWSGSEWSTVEWR